METTERRKTRKSSPKGNTFVFAIMLSNIIILVSRLLFSDMLGENGMGYYAAVYEMFIFVMLFVSWYLPQAEAKAVKARLTKGQIKNAVRVLKGTLLVGIGVGLVIVLAEAMLMTLLTEKLLLQPLVSLALFMMAPAILLSIAISAYRGYFEGMGTLVPSNISRVLEQIFALSFGLIFGRIFYNYGEKAGNLVQNTNYAPAYAVAGIGLGMVAAQVLILVFLMFVNRTYSRILKKQMSRDNSKILDSYADIFRSILSSGLPHMLTMLLIQGSVFIDMLLYMHYISKNTAQNYTVHYGSFYGKYAVVIGICICLIGFTMSRPLAAVRHFHKREEYRAVKDIFSGALHTFAIYGVPMAVLLSALAEPITVMLFGSARGTMFLLQVSSTLVLFVPCALFFIYILQGVGKQMTAMRNGGIAFVVQVIAMGVFLNGLHLGIASVAYGYMVLFGVMFILNGMSLLRYLKYTPDYMRMLAVPFIASAISGVLDMLLAKALLEKAGGMVTTIICVLFGSIGYVALLFALKGVNEKELSKIPGGMLLSKIGQILHLF